MIRPLSIGTTAQLVLSIPSGFKAKVTLQNLSANKVYILEADTQNTADGLQVVSGAGANNDDFRGELWLLADGVTSDVRLSYVFERCR
jgi:hypothetical protein